MMHVFVFGLPPPPSRCRQMHESNQPAVLHPFIAAFQWMLLSTPLGKGLVQVCRSFREWGVGSGIGHNPKINK